VALIERIHRLIHPQRRQVVLDVSIFGMDLDTSPNEHSVPYPFVTVRSADGEVVETLHAEQWRALAAEVERTLEGLEKVIEKHERQNETVP
jgi:hypothetical protein